MARTPNFKTTRTVRFSSTTFNPARASSSSNLGSRKAPAIRPRRVRSAPRSGQGIVNTLAYVAELNSLLDHRKNTTGAPKRCRNRRASTSTRTRISRESKALATNDRAENVTVQSSDVAKENHSRQA